MPKIQRRKEREFTRHRAEILTAALSLFAEKGYERTTMSEIAERAEFAVGTLYNFFADKRALYQSIIMDASLEFERVLVAALKSPGTDIERIEHYIDEMANLFCKHAAMARLVAGHATGGVFEPFASVGEDVRAVHHRVTDELEKVFRSAIRKKLIVKMEPEMLAVGLASLSNVFMYELVSRQEEHTADEMATHVKRLFFEKVRLDG